MNLDWYSKRQFSQALAETIRSLLDNPRIMKHANPEAVLLGGQSGAGKSTLHRVFRRKMTNDAIIINGDEYRKSHPHFYEIQAAYGIDAPAHTAKWSGAMTEALIDALSAERYNLIIEGTLRTSSVPMATAKLLRSRGYAVSLAIMAVKPEISLISCQIRYEEMRLAGTTPRATDPDHHRKIVEEIADNLMTLEESNLFDAIELYDRAGVMHYPPSGEADSAVSACLPTASETLSRILFGSWTEEERGHYAHLEARLSSLQVLAEPSPSQSEAPADPPPSQSEAPVDPAPL